MAHERISFWNRITYCVITGASQGIGRQISIQFAENVADESTFLLLARNIDKLNETKSQMQTINNKINIFTHSYNFCEPNGTELFKILNQSLDAFDKSSKEFELAIIVHNAGSLGDLTELTCDMNNIEKLSNYFTLNFFSVCILNSEFLKIFDLDRKKQTLLTENNECEICIVNITSLCAVKPFASMGYYCTGKSCREMYFSVMAEENKKYLILNYSPGPVLTDMTDIITSNIRNDEIREMFLNMKKNNTILSPQDTAFKLVKVLAEGKFKSGSRVDYFDELH